MTADCLQLFSPFFLQYLHTTDLGFRILHFYCFSDIAQTHVTIDLDYQWFKKNLSNLFNFILT